MMALRTNSSNLWKGLCDVWNPFNLNVQWRIEDGSKAKFWSDPWLLDFPPLMGLAIQDIPDEESIKVVANYTSHNHI